LKQRIIGAAVIIALLVIVLPMLFKQNKAFYTNTIKSIPSEPKKPQVKSEEKLEELVKRLNVEPTSKGALADKKNDQLKIAKNYQQSWVVQLVSYSTQSDAKKQIAKLRAKKFNAFVSTYQKDNKTYYRVYVGPYAKLEQAKKWSDNLNKELKIKGMVIKYQTLQLMP
jgi:DedD protein